MPLLDQVSLQVSYLLLKETVPIVDLSNCFCHQRRFILKNEFLLD